MYKIIRKIKNYYINIKWRIILFRKVRGKLKLAGNLSNLRIDKNFQCDGDLWIGIYSEQGIINIGKNVSASGPLIITCINKINIGCNVLFGPNIMICDHLHGNFNDSNYFETSPGKRRLYSKGAMEISNRVHIGFNVAILSPTKIKEGVVVGANSTIKGELAARSIYAGSPARKIK